MYTHVTGETPHTVNIVASGPTHATYHANHYSYNPEIPPVNETWLLNKEFRTCKGDLVFIMDDLIGEAHKSKRYAAEIIHLDTPVITSIIDQPVAHMFQRKMDNNTLHAYPINEVLDYVGVMVCIAKNIYLTPANVKTEGETVGYYLHNSIPFMLAYALMIGVKVVHLFGADYTFPGQAAREDDRANTEYWVGVLRAMGVTVITTADTTLLNMRQQPHIYGYGVRPPKRHMPTQAAIDELVAAYTNAMLKGVIGK